MIRQNRINFGEINQEWAKKMWEGFLRRTENMSYQEALREIPFLISFFCEIYPERCPPEEVEEIIERDFPNKTEKLNRKKSKNEFQLNLFEQ